MHSCRASASISHLGRALRLEVLTKQVPGRLAVAEPGS